MFIYFKTYHNIISMEETPSLRSIFAANVKRLRKELHLTQANLAELADISEPYMNDLELCKSWISDRTLVKIARALKKEPYELLKPQKEGFREPEPEYRTEKNIIDTIEQAKREISKTVEQSMLEVIKKILEK